MPRSIFMVFYLKTSDLKNDHASVFSLHKCLSRSWKLLMLDLGICGDRRLTEKDPMFRLQLKILNSDISIC